MIHRLPNNLTLIHRRSEANDIVAVVCLASPGAFADPAEKAGRTNLMMRLLSKGTKTRTSDEVAQALEGMGARLGTSGGYDYVSASLQCVRGDVDDAVAIFADVVRNPSFPLEEIRTEKARVMAEIRMKDDRSGSAVMKKFREQLFASSAYGRALEGEAATVDTFTQIDMVEAHRAIILPENMVVSVVGNIAFEDALKLVGKHFGTMTGPDLAKVEMQKTFTPKTGMATIVRDVEQSFIAMGAITCPLANEDTPAIDVASAILGEGMSSRLFVELRDKRSLAYSVGAMNASHAGTGYMVTYIGTKPETICDSIKGLWEQVTLLRTEPVGEDELARAKAYIVGGYLREHESNSQQASHMAYWHIMGMGAAYDEAYPDRVRAVTTRDVMRVANKYFLDPTTVLLRPAEPVPPCLTSPEQKNYEIFDLPETSDASAPPENTR